jgi:hypothetical protein
MFFEEMRCGRRQDYAQGDQTISRGKCHLALPPHLTDHQLVALLNPSRHQSVLIMTRAQSPSRWISKPILRVHAKLEIQPALSGEANHVMWELPLGSPSMPPKASPPGSRRLLTPAATYSLFPRGLESLALVGLETLSCRPQLQ